MTHDDPDPTRTHAGEERLGAEATVGDEHVTGLAPTQELVVQQPFIGMAIFVQQNAEEHAAALVA
jgi:hypothetical protein